MAFASLDEVSQVTAALREQRRAAAARAEAARVEECQAWAKADNVVGIDCRAPLVETVTVTGGPSESITNVQHAGIDEGDIVKRHGDALIVLRRGRLFSVRVEGDGLKAVDVVDVDGGAPEDDDPHAWYDELLVWQDTAVVIGYNYARGGTEIGLFDLSRRGRITPRATYHLRSDDYYSSSNYASRLIGHTLVLYTTASLADGAPAEWLPALRRWRGPRTRDDFQTIAPVRRIFRTPRPLTPNMGVHTQVLCDLATPELRCEATVLLAEPLAVHYTSPTAAYAWTSAPGVDGSAGLDMLYRLPFDGGPVTAVGVQGTPVDQLAFRERADGTVQVVASTADGAARLIRIPAASFTAHAAELPAAHYQEIARDFGPWPVTQFIGGQVVVASSRDDEARSSRVAVIDALTGASQVVTLPHEVERIEAVGTNAVVVGQEGEALRISTLQLGASPRLAGTMLIDQARQDESRSHGFFYRHDDSAQGVFGLPITISDSWNERAPERARVVFVSQQSLALSDAGSLAADPERIADDDCRVSCADWYGNARPLFIGDRLFALMGYELVEGRLQAGQVGEVRRLDFSPGRRRGR